MTAVITIKVAIIINSVVIVISVELKVTRKMSAENRRLITRKPAISLVRRVIQVDTANPIKKIKIIIMLEHGETVLEAVSRQMATSHPIPT